MNAAELAALRAEIVERVPAAVRETRDSALVASSLNEGRTAVRRVPIEDVQAYLHGNGSWWQIKAIARDPQHAAFLSADAVVDVASARYTNLDMGLPIIAQMFGGLVLAGAMTQAHVDDLMAMATIDNPASDTDVHQACWADEGEWTVWP